jgi:hypothetical protein
MSMHFLGTDYHVKMHRMLDLEAILVIRSQSSANTGSC